MPRTPWNLSFSRCGRSCWILLRHWTGSTAPRTALDDDPRMARLREAIEIILHEHGDRAEQIQLIFSREYDENWSTKLGLTL